MPFTTYYYQFTVCDSDNKSPVGRTKTTPAEDDEVTEIGIAVYSCSNYREICTIITYIRQNGWPDPGLIAPCVGLLAFGFFNAYGNPVRKASIPSLGNSST